MEIRRVGEFVWEIPRSGGMKVPARAYLSAQQIDRAKKEKALEQLANVAYLPGIVGHALAMPDMHWGYGFPIGGVAAVDAETGAISPGGVGYDINCLAGEARVLHAHGYTRNIRDIVSARVTTPVATLAAQDHFEDVPVAAGFSKPCAEPAWEVVTASGRRVVATADHPFLTPHGMRKLGVLRVGDRVAAVARDGVPYEAPRGEVIVSEDDVRRMAAKLGKTDAGHGLSRALRALAPLLPLTSDHPALPVLLKVFGYTWGDGTLYWEKARMKGRVVVYGAREDLEDMARDLAPWCKASPIHTRTRSHRVDTIYGEVRFDAIEHSARIGGTALMLLFAAMGCPVGPKSAQTCSLPEFLRRLPRWQQRLFLAGFFGAEMSTPDAFAERGKNFKCPVLVVVKRTGHVASGKRFLRAIADLLRGFGVEALTISQRDEQLNPDGTQSVRLRLVISSRPDNLVALWSSVGFEYNRKRARIAAHAASYLMHKRAALAQREEARRKIVALRKRHAWSAARIHHDRLAAGDSTVNLRFIERTTTTESPHRTVRSAVKFPSFVDWLPSATRGLGASGAVWDTIVAKRPRRVARVYDITVDHADHNFVANGFVVHNCGVRVVTTQVTAGTVKPKLRALVGELYDRVPTGVGASKAIAGLSDDEVRAVMRDGARWAVQRGFAASDDDAERCEEEGCLRGADPEAVSDRAVQRGSDQLGTLGSGNHFLEIDRVDEIYDAEAAAAFGLFQGQLTVMIHSGSRGLGYQVCDETLRSLERTFASHGPDYAAIPDRQLACAPIDSPAGKRYLGAMQAAANFAWANRQVMTGLAIDAIAHVLGVGRDTLGARLLYDVCHNVAKLEEHRVGPASEKGESKRVLVHRKGATRAFGPGDPRVPDAYRAVGQPVLIPGDMGRYSFVLAGNREAMTETFGSSCHGAGRVMSRTAAKSAARGRRIDAELRARGIEIKAKGLRTLAEEMSEAYKDVADVVDVIAGAGISRKVARLVPIGVIKG
jgi:tRNA-splicing ligase RtcB (3'-phosphate/5'-hydroxy nucleic acid ligase)